MAESVGIIRSGQRAAVRLPPPTAHAEPARGSDMKNRTVSAARAGVGAGPQPARDRPGSTSSKLRPGLRPKASTPRPQAGP
jgi:hypothetical protein